MVNIKEDYGASMVHKFFDKKIGWGVGANVNEVLAQESHKLRIKKSKENSCIPGLKIIFGQRI